MELDLQRFSEDVEQNSDTQSQTPAESSVEEQLPIPEELEGIPEDIARESMAEWEGLKAEQQPESAEPKSVTQEEYQSKAAEVEKLKKQLAEYQRRQTAPPPQQAPLQQPQFRLTPENASKLNEAITAEAMALTGMSREDIASLEYADEDDPRTAQWAQAKSLAQNRVYRAMEQIQTQKQQQAQQIYNNHMAAVRYYNDFVAKEFAEPDLKAIQDFAKNEFFEKLSPNEQEIVACSYARLERQTASPAEMLAVKNFYERAKAEFRSRNGKKQTGNFGKMNSPKLPRSDQLRGTTSKEEATLSELERMLDTTDFDKIPEIYQKKLLGY